MWYPIVYIGIWPSKAQAGVQMFRWPGVPGSSGSGFGQEMRMGQYV